MRNNYILIDYENIQPKNLHILSNNVFKLLVFIGASQKNVPVEFAAAMQSLGEKAKYMPISGNGSNALDFHVAFYMGEFAATDENAYFHIISRDTGFDPLITHMRGRKIYALRHKDLSEIPFIRITNAKTLNEKIDAIVDSLSTRRQTKPRKIRTLTSTIDTLFMKTLDEAEQKSLIAELQKRGHILIDKQSVSYGPAISSP